MSLTEIEAELPKLKPGELRRRALKSWTTFIRREGWSAFSHEWSEPDPALLAGTKQGHAADDVRRAFPH